jgi:uncharacterized BrkB/YihY/UPF0761 family membrane protein
VSKRADSDARKFPGWIANARQHRERYQDKLERRPWIAFPLESFRRFNKIEGKHLALVITLNLFVAVIPLMIIGYSFIEAFNPRRDIGSLLVGNLDLTGSTAQIVEDTFSNASSGKSVALSISLISLLITGLDVSATAQIAYARAFTMTPLHGVQKYLRGAVWLILLLADTGAALTLRSLATHHPLGFALAAGAVLLVLEFGFFLVTPRLLLDLPFKWRDLVLARPCARRRPPSCTPWRRCSCATGSASTAVPMAASASAWRWLRSSALSPRSGFGSPL